LAELLLVASQLLGESFRERAREDGLSVVEGRMLEKLAHADGMRIAQLADLLSSTPVTLTKAAERLERALLLQRRTPAEDHRGTAVFLTVRGRRIGEALATRNRADERKARRVLGAVASRSLRAALIRFIGLSREAGWPLLLENDRARSGIKESGPPPPRRTRPPRASSRLSAPR